MCQLQLKFPKLSYYLSLEDTANFTPTSTVMGPDPAHNTNP